MVKEFLLPDLGEGVKAGDVVAVHVAEGDVIRGDQTIVEIETDKAVLEVPCPFGGKVLKVHIAQGQKVKVGSPLISVDPEVNGSAAKGASSSAPPAKPEKKGQDVAAEPAVAPVIEKPPPPAQRPVAAPPTVERATPAKVEVAQQLGQTPLLDGEPIPAGPATRRLARELGLDLRELALAYPGQRITEERVKEYVRTGRQPSAGVTPGGAPIVVPALPDFAQWGPIERQPFSSLQRKTAEQMHASWSIVPHVTQFDEADVSLLETLRVRHKERGDGSVKLTVTAFAIKAAVAALKAFPRFNTSLDMAGEQLIVKKYYHIGVAVDTEAGLIVPVIRDADTKSVRQLAIELNEIAERTRKRKVGLDELRGGTFTITNLGGIGGTGFTPIVNYPQVAILGMARSRQTPTVVDGQLTTRLMLPLSLSYDHRVINGADGARFLRRIAELLENPGGLLLDD